MKLSPAKLQALQAYKESSPRNEEICGLLDHIEALEAELKKAKKRLRKVPVPKVHGHK